MAINTDINSALLEDVLAIYIQAEIEMLSKVAKAASKGVKSEGWNVIKLKQVQELKQSIQKTLDSTGKLGKSKLSESIIKAYKEGLKSAENDKKGTHETALDELDIPMNLKMQVLATNQLLDNASFQVLRNADDVYQQVMSNATTGLLAGTDTRINSTQKMLNEFASKGVTTFKDKSGRNWDLASYSEMCVRTVTAHAALQGHVDRSIEVGEDLVKVSKIGTTCPICARWEGVVLSISGNYPGYRALDTAKESGLFHPNCKHTLVMHIPELDGEGQKDINPPSEYEGSKSQERQLLLDTQRANERKIRYWKKRNALAITPEEKMKSQSKIKYWQHTNLLHCEKNNLRRLYAREGVRVGDASGIKGAQIGGNLKDYEELYKDVVGGKPKDIFAVTKGANQPQTSDKKYDKWLKDEIKSLDQLDIDKAQMKDTNNKSITPTSLYKKYIGDNPSQDYNSISTYSKGTSEYKVGYSKWLKEQIDDIGINYKVKTEYAEIKKDVATEDIKLSATELYKKYNDGKKPTDAYNEAGGLSGTGMKYGPWLKEQNKSLASGNKAKSDAKFVNSAINKKKDTYSKLEDEMFDKEMSFHKSLVASVDPDITGQDKTISSKKNDYLKAKTHFDKRIAKAKLDVAFDKGLEAIEKHLSTMYYKDVYIEKSITQINNLKKTGEFDKLLESEKKFYMKKEELLNIELGKSKAKFSYKKDENQKDKVDPHKTATQGKAITFGKENFSSKRKSSAWSFDSSYESYQHFIKEAKSSWRNVTPKEKNAIYDYTSASNGINRPLRGFDKSWRPENFVGVGKVKWTNEMELGQSDIEGMTSYIQKSKLEHDAFLTRVVNERGTRGFFGLDYEKKYTDDELSDLLVGSTVTDEGFFSTSASRRVHGQPSGEYGVTYIYNVYCPKGAHASYLEPVSVYGNGEGVEWDGVSEQRATGLENEVLLQRGTSFRCTKIKRDGQLMYIDIEVVGQREYDVD